MTPLQADNLLASLDWNTVVSDCGEGAYPLTRQKAILANNPTYSLNLTYSFGTYGFSDDGSVLTDADYKPQEKTASKDHPIWVNARHPPKNSMVQILRINEVMARGEGISIYEYEGREALRILNDTPCLYGLASHY